MGTPVRGVFPPGATVAASPQYEIDSQTDVFAVGNNGQLHVAWVVQGNPWAGPVGIGAEGVFPPGAAVAASPQYGIDNQTDVFATGNDNLIRIAWVEQGQPWVGPSPLTGQFTSSLAFKRDMQSGGLAAIGGWAEALNHPNGSTRWHGHVHDSGADGYDFAISLVVRTTAGVAVAFSKSGHVGGTFTPGDRDFDWDDLKPASRLLEGRRAELETASFDSNFQYESDIGDAFESLVVWAVKNVIGAALGPTGLIIFVGVEIGSLISTGGLVAGARVIDGLLWMAGPENTLYSLAAKGIVAVAGSQERELSQEEYDWANDSVFSGSLPSKGDLRLTDTIGADNRAFVFPRGGDGKILINMGPSSFANPRIHDGDPRGVTFIHELVHTCQVDRTDDLSLIAGALSAQLCGADAYTVPPPPLTYTDLGLEQQAQLVSEWFERGSDQNDKYFTYIASNVWVGVY